VIVFRVIGCGGRLCDHDSAWYAPFVRYRTQMSTRIAIRPDRAGSHFFLRGLSVTVTLKAWRSCPAAARRAEARGHPPSSKPRDISPPSRTPATCHAPLLPERCALPWRRCLSAGRGWRLGSLASFILPFRPVYALAHRRPLGSRCVAKVFRLDDGVGPPRGGSRQRRRNCQQSDRPCAWAASPTISLAPRISA
jgi:hypothetical protein